MKLSLSLAAWAASLAAVSASGEGFIGQTPKTAASGNSTVSPPVIAFFDVDDPDPTNLKVKKLMDELMGEAGSSMNLTFFGNPYFKGVIVPAHQQGGACKEALAALTEVSMVEDAVAIDSYLSQKQGAPWGLQRISNDAGASGSPQGQNFTYSFDDEKLGTGVDIYVVDTGVRTSHAVFTGRAQEGFALPATGTAADGDGHGTHCAGTAAGAKFGVAQGANVFAVKVLGDDGSGASSDTILGMNWVINNHEARKKQLGNQFVGSIMSMSWGLQGRATAVDRTILAASEAGIHVSVAAGNDGADACQSTPSHNGGANSNVVTVGAVNIRNRVSEFSNIGQCVDIYAPGEQVLSAWNTGDNVINFLSGTSMACPHTSGVMAYLMAQDPANLGQNPAALKKKLLETARENAFRGNTGGSANLLLSNGADGGIPAGTTRRLMKNYVVPDHDATLGGSAAVRASHALQNLGKRWELHSETPQLRY